MAKRWACNLVAVPEDAAAGGGIQRRDACVARGGVAHELDNDEILRHQSR